MTTWFPFLSLRSHRETIAAKDETIALLRDTVKQLTDSLEAFRETMVVLRTPQPRPARPAQEKEPAKAINYAALDPNDPKAILQAARAEMGPGKLSAPQIMRRAEQIKAHVIASREAAEFKAFNPGNTPPPDDIESLIAQTIAEGEAAGRIN